MFDQHFAFRPEMLVSWPTLREWIPRRVNACLEFLEAATPPEHYRALHLQEVRCKPLPLSGDSLVSIEALEAAARSGANGVIFSICADLNPNEPAPLFEGIQEIFRYLERVQMGVMLQFEEESCAQMPSTLPRNSYSAAQAFALTRDWLNRVEYNQYILITRLSPDGAASSAWLAQFRALEASDPGDPSLPPARIVVCGLKTAGENAADNAPLFFNALLSEARACDAVGIYLRLSSDRRLSSDCRLSSDLSGSLVDALTACMPPSEEVSQAHDAGLLVLAGPVHNHMQREALERLGVDIICQAEDFI